MGLLTLERRMGAVGPTAAGLGGARPGLGGGPGGGPGGVPVVSRCSVVPRLCLPCVLVVSRLCLGGILVVSRLCLGCVSVVSW